MSLLLGLPLFRGYVKFPGCNYRFCFNRKPPIFCCLHIDPPFHASKESLDLWVHETDTWLMEWWRFGIYLPPWDSNQPLTLGIQPKFQPLETSKDIQTPKNSQRRCHWAFEKQSTTRGIRYVSFGVQRSWAINAYRWDMPLSSMERWRTKVDTYIL